MEGHVGIAEMPTSNFRRSTRLGRKAPVAAALLVLAALAAGCSATDTNINLANYDVEARHPIMISEEPEVLVIPVGMNGPALSPQIEAAIRNYVAGYREGGTGSITIQVPTASANEVAAASTGQAIHYALVRAGLPHNAIQVAPYWVGDHSRVAAVRLAYLRVKAVAPECGVWPETTSASNQNGQYHNFGCAAQNNLAAMVANPADLVAPQPMGPANGARRAKVITDYSQGLDPKSETELIETDIEG
jgi:pilus assembly protein CpaD